MSLQQLGLITSTELYENLDPLKVSVISTPENITPLHFPSLKYHECFTLFAKPTCQRKLKKSIDNLHDSLGGLHPYPKLQCRIEYQNGLDRSFLFYVYGDW